MSRYAAKVMLTAGNGSFSILVRLQVSYEKMEVSLPAKIDSEVFKFHAFIIFRVASVGQK